MKMTALLPVLGVLACSGTASTGAGSGSTDPNAVFGPLEHGADLAGYTKLNTERYFSEDHGKRFVNTWVNSVALSAAFSQSAKFPEGSIIVKESFEGETSDVRGPIFVMKKLTAGQDPSVGDWWWAMHWEQPTPKFAKALGGPTYWRSPSKKVGYCWKCHEGWSDNDWVGGVPEGKRAEPPEGVEVSAPAGGDAGVEEVDEDF